MIGMIKITSLWKANSKPNEKSQLSRQIFPVADLTNSVSDSYSVNLHVWHILIILPVNNERTFMSCEENNITESQRISFDQWVIHSSRSFFKSQVKTGRSQVKSKVLMLSFAASPALNSRNNPLEGTKNELTHSSPVTEEVNSTDRINMGVA